MQNDKLRAVLEQIAATSMEEPGDAFSPLPDDYSRAQHYKWALDGIVQAAKEALASALQQQPEPVATEEAAYQRGKRAGYIDGYRAAHADERQQPDISPALQHQEEPREPVAVARPLTSEEEENAWNSITEQGCSCCTAAVRLFCRLNGITLSDAVLAASPSTTRQQEVGSGWKPIESAPKDGSEMLLSNGQIVAQGWWEHREPYIREHRDMDGRYIDQDEHDGYDGWLDFAGGMLPEPTHWMPIPAAPSTPEKAGGVSDQPKGADHG